MWTRGNNTLRSVNVNAPVNGVRPDPAVGNITEIQSSGKRAIGSLHRGAERALHAAAHPRHGDVSVDERAQLRRFSRRRCRRTAPIPTRTGDRRRRTCGIASSSTSTRRSRNGVRMGLNVQGVVGAALQHHHRPRRQRRHGVQRSRRRRDAQQRPRRDAVDREHAPQQVDRPRRRRARVRRTCRCPRRPRRPAARWPARGRRRSRRRRRSADGGDGRRQHALPAGPVPQRAERVQQRRTTTRSSATSCRRSSAPPTSAGRAAAHRESASQLGF